MTLAKDDFERWKTDPVTLQVMKYLTNFNNELVEQHSEAFKDGAMPSPEDFYRDSERYQTIEHLINLEFEDMEIFYDQTSMGQASSETE